ncbi:hypothetical protein CRUP_013980, partial [Coryphaenoides rupestris]
EERLMEKDCSSWKLHGEPTCKVYLVEDVLMSFLLSILEGGGSVDEHPLIQQLLDLFWLLMEIHYLRLTTAILHHEKSRKYLLSN